MGLSLREMAKLLNRNVSTISREIKRNSYKTGINNSVKRYVPTYANRKYKERRTKCHRSIIATNAAIEYIKNKIELKDLKNLINNMKDTAIVTVDLRALITDENVTESVTLKRGDNNGRD